MSERYATANKQALLVLRRDVARTSRRMPRTDIPVCDRLSAVVHLGTIKAVKLGKDLERGLHRSIRGAKDVDDAQMSALDLVAVENERRILEFQPFLRNNTACDVMRRM